MKKGRKDRNMMIMLCITAVVGATNILINGNFVFLFPYLLLMAISVPTLYFNYSLCKWENKWHSCWNERTPCDGEPSSYRLTMGKVGEWAVFIIGLILALIPAI